MAVTLYGDESESQEPRIFTLAGFIASTTFGWKGFVDAWRDMLLTAGPVPIDVFHANPLDKGEPPFDTWTRPQRDALVSRAIDILADTTLAANLYAIGCTFVVDELIAVDPRLSRAWQDAGYLRTVLPSAIPQYSEVFSVQGNRSRI
jgi:hypothetical protein